MTEAKQPPLMKAWVCPAYGSPDVLVLSERPRPVPRSDEILVRVRATTVSSGDSRVRAARLRGLSWRIACTLSQTVRSMMASCSPG